MGARTCRRLAVWAALILACGSDDAGPRATPAALPGPSAVDIVAAVPRPDDAEVLRLGTPASSREAVPSFASGAFGYAPQARPEVARALFEAASAEPRQGALFDRDLAACRVAREEAQGGLRRRDRRAARLDVTLSWGDARESVSSPHPAGTAGTFFVVPLLALARGDAWSASVRSDGDVHELAGVFDGAIPWRARADDLELECRRVDPAARAEAVRDALWGLDRKLTLLSLTSPTQPESLREIERFLDPIAESAEPVAALVGWDDPRLRRRFDRRAELEARLLAALVRTRAESLARAAEPGTWIGVGRMGRRLEAKVDAMTCEATEPAPDGELEAHRAWHCEATLSIDNGARGDRSLDVAGDRLLVGGASLSFVDRFGRAARVGWPDDRAPSSIDRADVVTFRVRLEPAMDHAQLQDAPSPELPVAFELTSERRRHRVLAPAERPRKIGRLPRPSVCEGPRPPAICATG
jgi:hypothetical protein